MGSTYSRKRVTNDINFAKNTSQPRNGEEVHEDGSSTSTLERPNNTAHKQNVHSINDNLKPNGLALTCTLRRNSRNSHHSNEILNTTCQHDTEDGIASSVIGDRLCHYTRDSTIPISFETDTNKVFSSVFDNTEIAHEEFIEDNNKNLEKENTFSTSHRREHLSTSEVISLRTGEELDLMTVHELYNCLNDGTMTSYIMDPFYILILDLRPRADYDISHIVTAQPSDVIYTELVLLFNYGYVGGQTSLRDFTMVVICGEASCDLEDTSCPELKLYHELQNFGIQPSILKGGYRAFCNQYPFLCSSKHITDEQERKKYLQTYPSEIIEGKLYQGRGDQATSDNVVKHLGVTHIINVCTEHRNAFPETVSYLNVNIEDLNSSCLKTYFTKCYEFIQKAFDSGGCVLVHCNLGMSRSSTISLSYLMEAWQWNLKEAYEFMKSKRQAVRPNRSFLRQLCEFEDELFGKKLTDPDDIWF